MIDADWKTNVTFIDLAWHRNRDPMHPDIDLSQDPFDFAKDLERINFDPPDHAGLFNSLSYWFIFVARALREVRHRVKIEACVGDVANVMEQIRYGVVGHRQQDLIPEGMHDGLPHRNTVEGMSDNTHVATPPRTKQVYPITYDHIHLSNVPDYMGGSLTTFLYALPLIGAGNDGFVTSNVLRNPSRFKDHDAFHTECLAVADRKDWTRVFNVYEEPFEPREDYPPLIVFAHAFWHR